MTIVFSVVGVVVAVASLLFSGWQARLLSRQSALENATAGAATIQNLFTWLHGVQAVLLREPRLLPYFHGGAPQVELSAEEAERLKLLASMYCDVLNIGLFLHRTVPQTHSHQEWSHFCMTMLRDHPAIREETMSKPMAYPDLERLGRSISTEQPSAGS